MKKPKNIVPHHSFQKFQQQYGHIPQGDKNSHIIKSRMLQGIYRNENTDAVYCNYINKENRLVNFMRSEKLESAAREELFEIKKRDRLTDENRLYTNLLSSQPLAFNIFLPLRWDSYKTATKAFQKLLPELAISTVTDIKLEYVPGDENPQRSITTDYSCFDVYIEYLNIENEKCGIGIEVKYTESFSQTDFRKAEGLRKSRYTDAVSKYKGQFSERHTNDYLSPKYNQLFRNQLITEEVMDKHLEIKKCVLAVIYSSADKKCISAINEFPSLLKKPHSYFSFTIESLVTTVIENAENDPELKDLYSKIYNRYCDYRLTEEYF